MNDADETARPGRPPRRQPRIANLLDVTEDMIAFADTYQQAWESEAKATIALGEFLNFRAQALRKQVELVRMGTDAYRRYTTWSEALFGVRPEQMLQTFVDAMESARTPPAPRQPDE
jgi:hypothetical protein